MNDIIQILQQYGGQTERRNYEELVALFISCSNVWPAQKPFWLNIHLDRSQIEHISLRDL